MERRGVSSENERDKPVRLCFRGSTHARDPGIGRVECTGGEQSVVVVALDDVAASFCKGECEVFLFGVDVNSMEVYRAPLVAVQLDEICEEVVVPRESVHQNSLRVQSRAGES